MFERLTTGWHLAKQSFNVLKLDKELLLFPVLSGVACVAVMASFALPLFASGMLESIVDENATGRQQGMAYVLMFLFYCATDFVIIFFNSALVACAIIRLKGGDPTVRDGLGAASARLPQIVYWALVSATVGMLLKIIESRSERVGQIVSGLLGMAWSVTTYFVVPILVVEKTGPVDAIKRSVSLMKSTWGESLGAKFGIGLFTTLASLLGALPIVGGVAMMQASPIMGGVLIALGILWILLVSLVASALNSIVVAALYLYASDGETPELFDSNLIQGAFAQK